MTAEIAILNKSAVALAADSAVTISIGDKQEKTYDSADKLFELSCADPISIMVNDNLQFSEIPLQVIIKKYRSQVERFDSVQDAAVDFLRHLSKLAQSSPEEVIFRSVVNQSVPLVQAISERIWSSLRHPSTIDENETFNAVRRRVANQQLDVLERAWSGNDNTVFLDGANCSLGEVERSAIKHAIRECAGFLDDSLQDRFAKIIFGNTGKYWLGQPSTGVIFTGFGEGDSFPTLIEYQLFGMLGGALKLRPRQVVDIDRNGDRAKVVPFAQSEMVERFLYGFDGGVAKAIRDFCEETLPQIANGIINQLDVDDETETLLFNEAINAEDGFIVALQEHLFESLGEASKRDIENMVEFMPKVELAYLAEQLVNLTSIKRRASSGQPTVGGPIDVAVISKAEGFVWVKRKHYFPPELNARYFDRIRDQPIQSSYGKDDD